MKIDSRAVIAEGAKLGKDVEIGPYAVIDADVTIGDGCKIGPHAYITGITTLGEGTQVHAGAVIGDAPQDVHYNDEPSYVDIGKNCVIRIFLYVIYLFHSSNSYRIQ